MVKIFVKDYGVMSFEMDYSAAKNTATNFVELARKGYYDDGHGKWTLQLPGGPGGHV